MGYQTDKALLDPLFAKAAEKYDIWAPVVKKGEGTFSDTDIVRYARVKSLDEIEWEKKSDYSFKEVLLPVNETIFYFTEDQTTVPKGPQKEILIFLRACDLHAVKRLDQIYLNNKFGDFYYARIREKTRFVLMGCPKSCPSGFCVSMGTNRADNYDAYLKLEGGKVLLDIKDEALKAEFMQSGLVPEECDVTPEAASENPDPVTVPKNLTPAAKDHPIFKEYGDRCITCGRCNFACPTCTCFTMQDIFYRDNAKVGERRRVWASCQVDGYTDIAGGIGFRKDKADRMRFKVMHKIYDFEKRFGYPMCVGCGRCDDICPEYISYANLIDRLGKEEQE